MKAVPSSSSKVSPIRIRCFSFCFMMFLLVGLMPSILVAFNLPFDLAMPDLHRLYKPLIDYNNHGAFKFLGCMGPDFAHGCSRPILDCLHHSHPINCIEHLECCINNKATRNCIHHLKSTSVYDKLFHVPIVPDSDGNK